jgi:drug/metabolite transporter (DMT)-like permease
MKKLFASPLFNVSLLSIFWALQIFVAKLGFRAGAELFTFSIQSLIGMFLILGIYVLIRKFDELKKVPLKVLLWLTLLGILASGLGGILSNAGIRLTAATNVGFLFQFDIAITIIMAYFLLKEKIDLAKILTVFFILLGTFFLITNGKLIVPHSGDIFILLACFCFAATSVLNKKIFKHTTVDPDITSLFRPLAAFPFLLLITVLSPLYPTGVREVFTIHLLNFDQIFYVVLNTICCVGILIFLNRTLKIASASYTAMMASVTPILVAILGIVFLQENLEPLQVLGARLIISASFITYLLKVDKH